MRKKKKKGRKPRNSGTKEAKRREYFTKVGTANNLSGAQNEEVILSSGIKSWR